VKSITVAYTPENDSNDSDVTIGYLHTSPNGVDIRSYVIYDTSRTISKKLAKKTSVDPERQAIEKCEREKELVISSLRSGWFVQASGDRLSPSTSTSEKVAQIHAILGTNYDVRLLGRLLVLYGAICPECYLANR